MRNADWEPWSSGKIPSDKNAADPTNGSLVVEYLEWCEKVRHRSPRTLMAYGEALYSYVQFIGTMDVRCVDTAIMEAWVTRPRKRRAAGQVGSAATQRKEVSILRSFYKYLWERDITPTDMGKSLHGPTVRNIQPKPIPDEDWVKIWAHADLLSDASVVALGLGFYCGLRRHEILGLTPAQVTPTHIVDFTRKGGGDDTVPWRELVEIHVDSLPWLAEHPERLSHALERLSRRSAKASLLDWPISQPDGMNKRMRNWCRNAGVGHYTPHQLRHSAATNLLRAGLPLQMVSRILNHSNVTTTMRYVRSSHSELAEWRRNHKVGGAP